MHLLISAKLCISFMYYEAGIIYEAFALYILYEVWLWGFGMYGLKTVGSRDYLHVTRKMPSNKDWHGAKSERV